SYRSSVRTLRRLVTGNLLYEAPANPQSEIRNPNSEFRNPKSEWDLFHIRNLGLAVNGRMAREFGGDAQRIKASSTGRVARRLGVSLKNWSPVEATAFENWALVLDLVPDLSRWSRPEKEAALAIVRAKAGREERRYLRLMQRPSRLREAVLRLGSGK
ncbi:MAG: hypothetical protein ACRD1P_05380, partial [Thermoanaerobaculia bacterium]